MNPSIQLSVQHLPWVFTDPSDSTSPHLSFLSSPQTLSLRSLPHNSKGPLVLAAVQAGHFAVPFDDSPSMSNPSANPSSFCRFPESGPSPLTLGPQAPVLSRLGYHHGHLPGVPASTLSRYSLLCTRKVEGSRPNLRAALSPLTASDGASSRSV